MGAHYWLSIFVNKPPVPVQKAYRSLCAFAINGNGADKLSPLSKFLHGSATGRHSKVRTMAPTPWGTRARAPHFYKWLGTGGTVSRRTANKKLTKLY